MKRLLFFLMLSVVMAQHVRTQTGIAGAWRAASVVPDGTSDGAIRILDFFLELKSDGTSVTGTVAGAPIVIREGRLEGSAVTLRGVINDPTASAADPR
jgi:hypothetical protein